MNRSDLVRTISRDGQLPQAQVEKFLDLTFHAIIGLVASGDGNLSIRNFGRFEIRNRRGLIRKNPKSGEDIKVPAKRAVLFHPAESFKERIQINDEDNLQ